MQGRPRSGSAAWHGKEWQRCRSSEHACTYPCSPAPQLCAAVLAAVLCQAVQHSPRADAQLFWEQGQPGMLISQARRLLPRGCLPGRMLLWSGHAQPASSWQHCQQPVRLQGHAVYGLELLLRPVLPLSFQQTSPPNMPLQSPSSPAALPRWPLPARSKPPPVLRHTSALSSRLAGPAAPPLLLPQGRVAGPLASRC